jgi:hypothetical protein
VWIKVCNMKFPIGLVGLHILTLKLESADTEPSKQSNCHVTFLATELT